MIVTEREEEGVPEGKVDSLEPQAIGKESQYSKDLETEENMEAMEEDGIEDMELGELFLDEIKECKKRGKGYVSRR